MWDLPIDGSPFAFIDLEMTGLNLESDRVVEVCIDRVVNGQTVRRLVSLLHPGDRVGGAAHVHGLDAAALADAPPFEAIASEIRELLDGAIPVAHAAEWDMGFLSAEFARIGVEIDLTHAVDTLVLARRAFALHGYSLSALCKHFEIARGNAHRAEADVEAMKVVFYKCVEALSPKSARDLWEVRIAKKIARAAIVEACERAVATQSEVTITYRPRHRSALKLRMILAKIEHDATPPRAIGYDLPGRSRREIRLDRILQVEPA